MTPLNDHLKGIGSGGNRQGVGFGATPPKTDIYQDVNGFVRIPNSGVVIKGLPEVLVGTTVIVEPDRGKTT